MSLDDCLCDGFEDYTHLLRVNVYILALNDQVVYVGRTSNALVRLFQHRTRGVITFNKVYLRSCLPEQASALEVRLIRELKPTMNVASSGKVRRLTQSERAAQKRELRQIVREELGMLDRRGF